MSSNPGNEAGVKRAIIVMPFPGAASLQGPAGRLALGRSRHFLLEAAEEVFTLGASQECRLACGQDTGAEGIHGNAQLARHDMVLVAKRDPRDTWIIGIDCDVQASLEHSWQWMRAEFRHHARLVIAGHADLKWHKALPGQRGH